MDEKNLQLERTVFFCDAVVAIAITLLIFNLKMDHVTGKHLSFKDLIFPWQSFLAFFLSFFNIANFWKSHHLFFSYIKKINESLLWYNIGWLFFIVLLPFSTSIVSTYFSDTAAMFLYSINIFIITIFQNTIWDYASLHPDFFKETKPSELMNERVRLFCNFDMANALIAVIVSFFNPLIAFILLFTKLPVIVFAGLFLIRKKNNSKK